jgi:hypothetical protein
VRDGPPQCVIHIFRKAGLLHSVVEHEAAEHRLARVARFFESVTDQSRIELIASPRTDPMVAPSRNIELRTEN